MGGRSLKAHEEQERRKTGGECRKEALCFVCDHLSILSCLVVCSQLGKHFSSGEISRMLNYDWMDLALRDFAVANVSDVEGLTVD